MKHKPVLIVIAGPNGSGKTTITSKILRHDWMEDAIYINPDIVAQEMFGDWNATDAVMRAAVYCTNKREEGLCNRKSLIFETVLSTDEKVLFLKRAKELGFFIRLFFVSTSHPTINAARIAQRVMKGWHDVPITKIISRYSKSIINCKRVAAFADRTYIYDNSVDDVEARLLFRLSNGQMKKMYVNDIPEWALTIL